MLVPIEWLKEYTEVSEDIEYYCDRMIMSGSNIETAETFGEEIEKVVVGKILTIERHPDADKLVVTKVDVGQDEPLQIVTGADNIFEGACVPVILAGGRLPGGMKIKKGKLRGVESCGMLCSAKELGYEDKVIPTAHKDGIWILDEEYTLGENIIDVLGLADTVVDFEITPNRPDCLSMIGMARETAATLGGRLKYPETKCTAESDLNAADFVTVEIKRPDLCRRYAARIVTDVKIGQSPWWLQRRLMYAGMRPINNIVDITNYVMLEYGQPIHAFDIRNVKDNKIVVDTAEEGQKFTTLDGVERTLQEGMLLINDGQRAVAIAGVMGGLNSEIEEDSSTILIESANFLGDSVRNTSKKLGLRTEASSRFEKGIDPNLSEMAADRVCKLIEILGCGKVAKGIVDNYPEKQPAMPVPVRPERVNHVLGITLSSEEMTASFESLEMQVEKKEGCLLVTPPTVRQDLLKEVDFIEEVARMYGYDKMPVSMPKGSSEAGKPVKTQVRDLAKSVLNAMGYNEIQTYSFVSPKGLDLIRIPEESDKRRLVKLINPLGEENSVMRTTLLPNMLEVMGRNYSRNIVQARAFEIGNTFINIPNEEGLPVEKDSLTVCVYGGSETFFTLKGAVVELLSKLGVHDAVFKQESGEPSYHPGRCGKIYRGELEMGIIGEIHPDVAETFGIDTKVYCCEIDFDYLQKHADSERFYSPLPKYPSTSRDIALLIGEGVPVGDIERIIIKEGGALLESVNLFDVYRGKQVPEGLKSTAFSLVYRASDRTLTDEETTEIHSKVLEALKSQLNAVLREV